MFRKILLILAAFIFSFAAAEFIVGSILGFPKYGVEQRIKGVKGVRGHQNIYKPYSEYWRLRGKFEIYKRNNAGLPGLNVNLTESSKQVCVLGSSFIENAFMDPAFMSTSIFQNLLRASDSAYNVLNLGHNGFDVYESYRRLVYFEQRFKPDYVFLVINDYEAGSFKLVDKPFLLDDNSFIADESFKTKTILFLRNTSSFIRLVSIMMQNDGVQTVMPPDEKEKSGIINLDNLEVCLVGFNERYPGRFVCVSITCNESVNKRIDDFCLRNGIKFEHSCIMTPDNQVDGDWHLNEKGNNVLGVFLYNSFRKHFTTIK
ncbi:MAG: hypothetical protein AB2L26_01275 [Ignavibacteria bacterium]